MLDFIKGLWNPVAFWISFMMSIIMPIIFGVIPFYLTGNGISLENCLILWPLRWLVAYLLINTFFRDTGLKLAAKVFKFDPGY